ncbi:MAG: ribonuclease HII [Proteobacteria bacterium]|nr:ribonuclease HII [Pseudomonadota bacterium]
MQKTLVDCSQGGDNFCLERTLYARGMVRVAGCDEAGRGPLAGPVVAASIILPTNCTHSVFLDSKILRHEKRVTLEKMLYEMDAAIGIGIVSEQHIDRINILQASLLAMKLAVENMSSLPPDFILVDGKFTIPLAIAQETLIKGESKSASIAAASILAKVARDRLMTSLHNQYPVYNFIKNKGYPTREHRLAIATYGPCPAHRRTFRGVKDYVE